MSEDRDWVGTWFELAEARGERCEIPFGTLAPNGEVTWRSFAHRTIDGIAAMAEVVGAAELPELAPALRERPARPLPSPFVRKAAARWKSFDASKVGEPSGRAHRFLSAEDTQRLRERAKTASVSVNSLLAWALAYAVREEVDRAAASAMLFDIPVNLRGAPRVAEASSAGNVFATLTVDLGLASPAAVHAAIQTALSRGEHWSSWGSLVVGREQGLEFVRGAAKSAAVPAAFGFRVGVFSNLGVWTSATHAGVVFCPPPAPRTPLAAGAVTLDGRLGLMLSTHAGLAEAAPRLEGWLDDWMAAALAPLSA